MKKIIILLLLCNVCYGTLVYDDLKPVTDGSYDLGSISLRWAEIYASTRVVSQILDFSDTTGVRLESSTAIGIDQLDIIARSGTNTDMFLVLDPKGTGDAYIAADATVGGTGTLFLINASLVSSEAKIEALANAPEGTTEALELFGFRTGDQLRSMTIGIGKDENDTVTFAGLSKYIFDGDFDFSNNALTNVGYIDFETGAVAPAQSEGRIFYDDDEKTLSVYNNEAEVTLQLGQEMFIRATNKTGSTILNGKLVYINGAQGSRPTIALAKADAIATCQVIAMATHDIEDNTTGFVTNSGLVHDVNTDGISAGDAVYLSAATAGEFTDTAPTAPSFIIQAGRVIFENATSGIIHIAIGPTAVCGTMVIQDLDINVDLDVTGDITADDITGTSLTLDLANDYLLTERTGGQSLAVQNQTSNITSRLELFPKDGDGLDGLDISVYAKGLPADITNSEFASLSYITVVGGGPLFALHTTATGTGTVLPWSIYTGMNTTQLVLNIDNSIDMSGALGVTGTVSGATGSTFGTLTLADGSITDSSNAIDFGNEALSTSGTITGGNYISTGDADTLIRFPAADNITIEAGGLEFLRAGEGFGIGFLTVNAGNADVDLVCDGDTVEAVLKVDAGLDTNLLKNTVFSELVTGPKFRITLLGGYAVLLTNKTGGNSVAGDVVKASAADADSVILAVANELNVIGVFLDSGIADGSEAWVVVAGIAEIHMDAGGCALGDRIVTSATAGRGAVNNAPSVAVHFQEIGHAIQAAAANGNARCIIHFL
ncbi:MAG: hypothetical protein V3U75_04055 [Methylococcaceae bacterium]